MLTSAIRFLDLATGRPCDLAPAGAVLLSSAAAGWSREVVVERLRLPPAERSEHGILDHRLIVNLGPPVPFGWHQGDRARDGVFGTGAVHVQPHGAVNRPRWRDRLDVASFAFAPALFERLLDGRAPAAPEVLAERRNLPDPVAYECARRLTAELAAPTERLYGETLCLALAQHLLRAHGRAGSDAGARSGGRLSPARASRVLERMRAGLGGPLPVAELAAEAGLSEAHFARAFRATLGEPPHRLLLRWRLERAGRLISDRGVEPAEAALAAGFFDQAHLTHAMRRHRGTTPGALARARGVRRGACP